MNSLANSAIDCNDDDGDPFASALTKKPKITLLVASNGNDHIDFARVAAEALLHAKRLIELRVHDTKLEKQELWFCDPCGDSHSRKMSINLQTGKWSDIRTNEGGADIVSLIAHLDGTTQLGAARSILGDLSIAPNDLSKRIAPRPIPQKEIDAEQEKARDENIAKARKVYDTAKGDEALGLAYLASKGVEFGRLPEGMKIASALREAQSGTTCPALIVGLRMRHDGGDVGIQRIWLKPDGTGRADLGCDKDGDPIPAKKTLGPAGGFWFGTPPAGQDLFVTESIEKAAAIFAATGIAAVGVPGASMVGTIEWPSGAHVIAACDNDAAGIKANARIVTTAHAAGLLASSVLPPDGMDWDDVLVRDGAEALAALLAEHSPCAANVDQAGSNSVEASAQKSSVEQVQKVQSEQVSATGKPVPAVEISTVNEPAPFVFTPCSKQTLPSDGMYMIAGLVPCAGYAVVVGESGSSKTNFVFEMMACIATGADFYGHKVRTPGNVCYLALEDAPGARVRAMALSQKHVWAEHEVFVCPTEFDLHSDKAARDRLATTVAALKPVMLVIDTLACGFGGGNENDTRDMNLFVANVKRLAKDTGALVLLVHHVSKGSPEVARGSGSLHGGADMVMLVQYDASANQGCATVKKLKNGPVGGSYGFALQQVTVGTNEHGDAVTSVVVNKIEGDFARASKKKTLPPAQKIALDALNKVLTDDTDRHHSAVSGDLVPNGAKICSLIEWEAMALRMSISKGNEASAIRAFERAATALKASNLVGIDGDRCWRPGDKISNADKLLKPRKPPQPPDDDNPFT